MIPIHVDLDAALGEQYVDYRCSRCGMVAQAAVAGYGTGLAVNGVSLSNAQLEAEVGAARAARLAPCPRCGHRSRPALLAVLLVGATVGVVAAMAIGFTVAELFHRSDPDGRLAPVVGAATFLAVVATVTALKLRSVRRRVRFHRVML
jgi:DNA-directed RNA polymerase subunit RPC12/RpoP